MWRYAIVFLVLMPAALALATIIFMRKWKNYAVGKAALRKKEVEEQERLIEAEREVYQQTKLLHQLEDLNKRVKSGNRGITMSFGASQALVENYQNWPVTPPDLVKIPHYEDIPTPEELYKKTP